MSSLMCKLKPITFKNLNTKSFTIGFLLTSSLLLNSPPLSAAGNEEQDRLSDTIDESRFEYILENRPDPFVPFLTEKAATVNVDMNISFKNSKLNVTGFVNNEQMNFKSTDAANISKMLLIRGRDLCESVATERLINNNIS